MLRWLTTVLAGLTRRDPSGPPLGGLERLAPGGRSRRRHPMSPKPSPLAALGLALLFLTGPAGGGHAPTGKGDEEPPEVTVSQPLEEVVSDYIEFTGQLAPIKSVEVRSRVSGYLTKVFFEEGSEVKAGDKLYEIDQRPYKAALDRAKGDVTAGLARLKRYDADLARAESALALRAISRADYDNTVGDRNEIAGTLDSLNAAVKQAQLNLDYTVVTSEIDAVVSKTRLTPGNLVKADNTLLTTVVSVDPIHGYFYVADNTVLRVGRLVRQWNEKYDEKAKPAVFLGLADEEGSPHKGTMDFADNKVTSGTGTILVRGVFPNPDRLLNPGLFMRVRMPLGAPRKSILVSERALGSDQGQKFLLVVDGENKVVSRRVKVGSLNDGLRVIEEGVSPGEWVIVDGLPRVRPGDVVAPKREPMPRQQVAAPAGEPDGETDKRPKVSNK